MNFRIGSVSYDSDMDIIENFVKVHTGQANEEEIKGLQLYYISRIYNYFGKLKEFINKHEEVLNELNSDEELRNLVIKLGLGEKKIIPSDTDGTVNGVLSKILLNKGYYAYLIDEDRANKFLNIHRQKDAIYKFVQYKIGDLEREYGYHKVRSIFSTLGMIYCFTENPDDIYRQDFTLEDCSSCCILPNDTGLFGLNTYLYAHFHSISLIGVPAGYQSFDNSIDECVGEFIDHDLLHTKAIEKTRDVYDSFKPLYFDIILDQESGVLQKELFCLVLWILAHESQVGASKILTNRANISVTIALTPESLKREFYDEFMKFRDLVLVPEVFKSLALVLPHRKIYSMEDVYRYLDPTGSVTGTGPDSIIKRSEVMMMFIFMYARIYFLNYYSNSMRKIRV